MFDDNNNGTWHTIFNHCANLLQWLAKKLDRYTPGGMDYVKINVILFCIVLPILFLASLVLNFLLLFGIL